MMAPEYPTPTMLALDTLEARIVELLVAVSDKRDAAKIHRRWASEELTRAEGKDLEADAANRRVMRMPLVRARILRSGL